MSIVQSWIQTSDLFYRISSPQVNLNIRNLVGSNLYDAKYRKRVVIDPGVTIGSNTTGSAALQIPSALGGDLIIDNYGSIQGSGGPSGNNGGDAILAQAFCKINNKSGATIYAGGGGGGNGGTGGSGGSGTFISSVTYLGGIGIMGGCGGCVATFGPNAYESTCVFFPGWGTSVACSMNTYSPSSGGGGGSGGVGGRGRGYDGALASGSGGSAGSAGGSNAGTGGSGGAGGSGGDWGQSGVTGSIGLIGSNGNASGGLSGLSGAAGGLAGFYINGLSTYVTLTNNGTVAGRTN